MKREALSASFQAVDRTSQPLAETPLVKNQERRY
jgi:hypothetical protein